MNIMISRFGSILMSARLGAERASADMIWRRAGVAARHVVACCLLAGLCLASPADAQTGADQGNWATKSSMPGPRNEVVAAAVNDKIYVFGGSAAGNWALPTNEEYDPATDKWRSRAPVPSGASHMTAAVLGGKIYVIGGFIGRDHKGAVDRVFEYDPAADTWRARAPLSAKRGSVSAAVLDGKIHAIGGRETAEDGDWHYKGVVATHEVYDPATDKWTQAAPLPKPRDHLVVGVVEGKIHAIGGRFAGNDDMVNWHDVYDPATKSWSPAAPLPTARGGVSGTIYKGLIMVIGGEDEKRAYVENEAYDAKAGLWRKLAPMPFPHHGHAVAAVGPALYVSGGALKRGSGDTTDQLLAFTLP